MRSHIQAAVDLRAPKSSAFPDLLTAEIRDCFGAICSAPVSLTVGRGALFDHTPDMA